MTGVRISLALDGKGSLGRKNADYGGAGQF